MENMNIRIRTPFIKLEQLLKLAGMVDTGGLAKSYKILATFNNS